MSNRARDLARLQIFLSGGLGSRSRDPLSLARRVRVLVNFVDPGSIPTGCTFVTADNTGHRVGSDSPTHGALLPKAVSGKRLVGGGFGSNRYMTASVTTVVPHEAKEPN